jgi:hypothetical protein
MAALALGLITVLVSSTMRFPLAETLASSSPIVLSVVAQFAADHASAERRAGPFKRRLS